MCLFVFLTVKRWLGSDFLALLVRGCFLFIVTSCFLSDWLPCMVQGAGFLV